MTKIDLEIHTKIGDLIARLAVAQQRIEGRLAYEGEAMLKNAMQSEKSGRIYERGGSTHQASAPGEAPATDTGAYLNSIAVNPRDDGHFSLSTSAAQAVDLEYGSTRVDPRPMWYPTADALNARLIDVAVDEINRAIAESATL